MRVGASSCATEHERKQLNGERPDLVSDGGSLQYCGGQRHEDDKRFIN